MCFYQSCEGCVAAEQEIDWLYGFLQMLGMNRAMHTSRIYFETVPSLSWRQITCFGFILQFGPPGIYQPGQITDRAVLNVYGGLSEWRADGYLLDKYQVRILVFYYWFLMRLLRTLDIGVNCIFLPSELVNTTKKYRNIYILLPFVHSKHI